MKVLAIGNSFSNNAMTHLSALSGSAGVPMKTINMCIGGCSLRTHYLNMLESKAAYGVQFNGKDTGLVLDLKQGMLSDEWDVITLQQVSQLAPRYESYQPYLDELAAFVRKYFPKAKIMMHQTWAYEEGSPRLFNVAKYDTSAAMFADIQASYRKAADAIGADGIIPAGAAMLRAVENGIPNVHADSFHCNAQGLYTVSLTWYGYLTGKPVEDVPFNLPGTPLEEKEIAIIKRSVAEVLGQK